MIRQIISLEMILFALALLGLWFARTDWEQIKRFPGRKSKPKGKRRTLKPKSPEDCPLCQAEVHLKPPPEAKEVVPWSERKSGAGWPKTVSSEGVGCPNEDCDYCGITDETIHALVSQPALDGFQRLP